MACQHNRAGISVPSKDDIEGEYNHVYQYHKEGEREIKNGTYRSYLKGSLVESGTFVNGLRDGPFKFWRPNGLLECCGSFKEGRRDGNWNFFSEVGALEYSIEYSDGEPSAPKFTDDY